MEISLINYEDFMILKLTQNTNKIRLKTFQFTVLFKSYIVFNFKELTFIKSKIF